MKLYDVLHISADQLITVTTSSPIARKQPFATSLQKEKAAPGRKYDLRIIPKVVTAKLQRCSRKSYTGGKTDSRPQEDKVVLLQQPPFP